MTPDKRNIISNFKSRNIEVDFFDTLEDVKNKLVDIIPDTCSVGIGNSTTLKKMEISRILGERGNKILDKTLAKNKEESRIIKKKALLSDWYITGSNAVSEDGHIVNIDHSGNRVAALIYGPENVIIVVGRNKVVKTIDDAIYRAKNVAAPLNAKRAGLNPPCVKENKCIECNSKDKVCNNIVITQGQVDKERLKLYIINEEVGF